MTIQKIDTSGRLLSAEHSDPKPDSAPGILLLETDTGVWWVSQGAGTWKPCAPTVDEHQALMNRAAALELDVEAKAVTIAAMQSELAATRAALKRMETDIADLWKRRPA